MMDIDIGTGLTILGLAFGGWAGVVAWGVGVVRHEVKEIKDQILVTSATQIQHINQTERRLTMLETEFGFLRRTIYKVRREVEEGHDHSD